VSNGRAINHTPDGPSCLIKGNRPDATASWNRRHDNANLARPIKSKRLALDKIRLIEGEESDLIRRAS
jgi:hypothetical protein